MRAFRVKKVVPQNGRVELEALPFQAGEVIEIIVLALDADEKNTLSHHILKDSVLDYIDPTEPVAFDDWEVTNDPP